MRLANQLPGLHRKTGYFSFMFFVGIVCFHVCGCSVNFIAVVAKMTFCNAEWGVVIMRTFS